MSHAHLIDQLLSRNATFAAFRVPGSAPRVWVQLKGTPILVDASDLDKHAKAFVVAPFLSQMGQVHIIRADAEFLLDGTTAEPQLLPMAGADLQHRVAHEATKEQYMQGVERIKQAIQAGPLRKAVLARTHVHRGPVDLASAFLRAMHLHPEAMVALVHTPIHGTWISASPERLVHFDGPHFAVDSLAATMPTTLAPADVAQWGEKEQAEHAVVTERILAKLERASVHAEAGPRNVKHAGRIAHLHAVISGVWSGQRGLIPLALHPTPAVGGEPVYEAQEIITTLEPDARGLYAGFWGPWQAAGVCDLYVNIRCMEVVEGGLAVHVGAGIVSGSDPAAEWAETQLKARIWLDMIEGEPTTG